MDLRNGTTLKRLIWKSLESLFDLSGSFSLQSVVPQLTTPTCRSNHWLPYTDNKNVCGQIASFIFITMGFYFEIFVTRWWSFVIKCWKYRTEQNSNLPELCDVHSFWTQHLQSHLSQQIHIHTVTLKIMSSRYWTAALSH